MTRLQLRYDKLLLKIYTDQVSIYQKSLGRIA